jgi:hypothetical protein
LNNEELEMTVNTTIAEHLSLDEVKMKLQMMAGSIKIQKWLVIYNAIVDPRPISEIAKHTGLSEASVLRIIADYNKRGPEAIEASNKILAEMWFDRQPMTLSM